MLLAKLCSAQEGALFKAEANLVSITALVRSSNGDLLTDLGKDDFQVLEDGVPQRIQFFARERQVPLSLGLVIDVSGSQEKFIKQHDRDVERFLTTVLGPGDKAVAVCFGNHLRLVSDMTSKPYEILDGLHSFAKGDHHFPEIGPEEDRELGTALYDAVYFTAKQKLMQSDERRRAIILFSDGEENSSEHDLLDAIQEAQDDDILIYSIRYTGSERGHRHKSVTQEEETAKLNARNKYGIRVMNHLASLSGGSDFDALQSDLDCVFTQIGTELHSLYSIGYLSTNPSTTAASAK